MGIITMPISGNATGEIYLANTDVFPIIGSRAFRATTEADAKVTVYESLTWANLYVKVTVNDASSTTSCNSRVNGAAGNMSVSIGAGITGEFEDNSNSDALVADDDINYQLTRGAGGTNWRLSMWSTTLENADNGIKYMIGRDVDLNNTHGTRFMPLINETQQDATEDNTEFIIRFAATLSKLRVFFSANTFNASTTIVSRINAGDGNLTVSIGAGATGEFEDTSNSDTISAGDTVDLAYTEASSSGLATMALSQVRLIGSDNDSYIAALASPKTLQPDTNRRASLEGAGFPGEADGGASQVKFRAIGAIVNNLYTRIQSNQIDGASTFTLEVNDSKVNLTVSIPANTTGNFEDNTNTDTITVGDEVNYLCEGGTGLGNIGFEIISIQSEESSGAPADPPTITVTTPAIDLTLSGTRAAVLNAGVYVVEHQIPGMSGGIIEKTGFPATRIQYRGFFYSGADDEKKKLIDAVGKQVKLAIPSTNSGQFFFSGIVFISRGPNMTISPGRSYAYYDYNIEFVSQS